MKPFAAFSLLLVLSCQSLGGAPEQLSTTQPVPIVLRAAVPDVTESAMTVHLGGALLHFGEPVEFAVAAVSPAGDGQGVPAMLIEIAEEDQGRLLAWTQEHLDEKVGIFVQDRLLMAPYINSAMSDRVLVQGNFSETKMEEVLGALNGSNSDRSDD